MNVTWNQLNLPVSNSVKYVTVNDISKPIKITVHYSPDYDYDSSYDMEDIQKGLENGSIGCYVLKVTADYMGFTENEYLGGCLVTKDSDLVDIIEEYNLVDLAVDSLRESIELDIKTLKVFSKVSS